MGKFYAAIPTLNSCNNLSEQEFQEMLSSWLEDKGVLMDLRTQLRLKMVNALKNTAIGKKDIKNNFHQMSLFEQAINTIIAEYLLQNKCHYSLSVFNTEVPLTRILPDFPETFSNGKMLSGAYHFNKMNILNIMELIGIDKNSIYCEEVLTLYFDRSEQNSLLSCIIRVLCKFLKENDRLCNLSLDGNTLELNAEDNFIKQVVNYLNSAGLSSKSLKVAIEHIKNLHKMEIKDREEEYSQFINDLTNQISNQEKQRREMFNINKTLRSRLSNLTKDYKKLTLHTRNLIFHEKVLKGYHARKHKHNKELSAALRNDYKGNNSISYFDVKLNNSMCQLQHCGEICKDNKVANANLLKQNRNLIEENERQREHNKKLTLKYKQLISEFNECQQHISLLHSKLNRDCFGNVNRDSLVLPVDLRKHMNANEDGSDITEKILHEARLRMKQLDEETKTSEDKRKLLNLKIIII